MDADIKWLDEPETFRVNQLPAHSDHYYYGNYDEWRHNNSRFAQNLDGQWQFNFAENPREREEDFYKTDYDSSSFGTIEVPSEIELNNYAQNNYINTLIPWEGKIYRRPAYALSPDDAQEGSFSDGDDNTVGEYLKHFDLEPSLRGKQVRIRFDGVERAMYVWLNGHFIGYAEDSFTPSEFDLTPYIQDEGNVLAVEVFKHSTASWIEDQDMFRFSGIFRSVNLLAQPLVHVEDLNIRPIVTDNYQDGIFNVDLQLHGEKTGNVNVRVIDNDGNTLVNETHPVDSTVEVRDQFLENIHLWDNHDPYLYQLLIEIRDDEGNLVELVPYHFGFRRIEINKDHVVLLNGQRLIINGVNLFPVQIERKIMGIPGVGKNYVIEIRKENYMDRLYVKVEVDKEIFNGTLSGLTELQRRITDDLRAELSVSPVVELVEPSSLPVWEGKAKRVIDRRGE